MKVLKWLWFLVLVTIGFKIYGIVSNPYVDSTDAMESTIGMVLIFIALSAIIIVSWLFGLAKRRVSRSVGTRRSGAFAASSSGSDGG